MEMNNSNSRRNFIGALALGATASGLASFINPLHAAMAPPPHPTMVSEAEAFFKKIKGTHRVVYDGSTPHHGFPIAWNWAFYLTNNQTGSPDSDITAMTVLRHNAIGFALEDRVWEKYKLGEHFGVTDHTKKPALRNPYYQPQEGDFPLPPIEGIKKLQERGALFCVCSLALMVNSLMLSAKTGIEAKTIEADLTAAILPQIQAVPSGVWALARAQAHGCGYVFAGD
jgi:intracellular sulfur oxidation DsrE/DsrF family protein